MHNLPVRDTVFFLQTGHFGKLSPNNSLSASPEPFDGPNPLRFNISINVFIMQKLGPEEGYTFLPIPVLIVLVRLRPVPQYQPH